VCGIDNLRFAARTPELLHRDVGNAVLQKKHDKVYGKIIINSLGTFIVFWGRKGGDGEELCLSRSEA